MDDDETIREIISTMLEISGYAVETTDDGQQAITCYGFKSVLATSHTG